VTDNGCDRKQPERILDPRQAVHLCQEGAPEFTAIASVDRTGHTRHFWLWSREGPDRAHAGEPPSHERTGRLPQHVQARVDRAAWPRCGRPRADGQPCRKSAVKRGAACHLHDEHAPKRR
jgi:hypothetical protein